MRMYVDYHQLNKLTFRGAFIFSKIDLHSSYNKLKDKETEALRVPSLAFLINKCSSYVHGSDESSISVISGSHDKHIQIVLQILREKQMYAKFTKCESWLVKT
ncbi:RNA-directed DNA polymerase-like protein [Gossypium australe]|uniref:RNA-directed DNA polymerase-like protein n=1 Tax=Gossypium australe TaxID=47621 RepID=A0A5B6VWC1_9ROSI|nr:RNA-directed DNA polymerase-like protein [Gossypium australe]